MKYLILLLPLMIACGKSDSTASAPADLRQQCASGPGEINGVYDDKLLNKLILRNDCLGETQDACNHTFTYYKPVGGKMLIDVKAKTSTSDSCIPLGEVVCDVDHHDPGGINDQVMINCGKGTVIYYREGTF